MEAPAPANTTPPAMQEALRKPNGANFLLADLHLHTPADAGFTCPDGTDLTTETGRKAFARQYVDAAQDAGLSMLGITDHNSVEWVDLLREAAQDSEITIFPGFELAANSGAGGIHLVCLFEPDRPQPELDDIITRLGLPRGNRLHDDGSNKLCDKNLAEAVDFIREVGGLPIAAHVLRDHGILQSESMTGEVRVQAWTNPQLVAAELPHARSRYAQEDSFAANAICNKHDLYERTRPIACIYSSDARALDQLARRPTWIKVSSRDITGLKHAFLDWESRIRHPDELVDESFSRIVAAEWEGGFLDGMRIHFNNNLNCVIGGKGTGKSTIIESLRYALTEEPSAQEAQRQHRSIIDEVFQPGSTVRVLIQCHSPSPTSYLVERGRPGDAVVYRWDEDSKARGDAVPHLRPGDILQDIEVYGQKEILELSRDESIQLRLLQRFIPDDDIRPLLERENEALRHLDANATALLELEQDLETAQEQERELGRLQEQARQYEQLGLRERLAEQREYVTEQTTFTRAEEEIRKVEDAIDSLVASGRANANLLDDDQLDSLPHPDLMREVQAVLDAINTAVEASVQTVRTALASGRETVADIRQRWEPDNAGQLERYQAILRGLQVEAVDPNQYLEVEQRIQQLRPRVNAAREASNRRGELRTARSQLLAELQVIRRERFQVFNRIAEGLHEQLAGVLKIALTYQGQGEVFAQRLTELRSNARGDQIKRIVQHREFTPAQFADCVRRGAATLEASFQITHAAAEALCSHATGSTLFELEVLDIPASISIALNLGTVDQPNFKETSHLSVGQRCTAILMLILLHNPYPLVVDQPEDDLDNSFVYTDIVQRLRREKERRQFLIATHNANIPVLGDAELIQVLRAERGRLLLEDCPCGSIDDRSMRGPVERILEGGHDAFEMRKAKYGF